MSERVSRSADLWRAGRDGAGTALEDAFKLLSLASRERLRTLTFKLCRSGAEELVQAMSLISLGKATEGLAKLRKLGNSAVARCLRKMLESGWSCTEAFPTCRTLQLEPEVDGAIELARIFRLMVEEKLCEESRRDEAYRAALWACSRQTGNQEGLRKLERFVEEAREACGPGFGAMYEDPTSCQGRKSTQSLLEGLRSLFPLRSQESKGSGSSMRILASRGCHPSKPEGVSSPPSSLRTCPSSGVSYPSHLEVSMSSTTLSKPFNKGNANHDVQHPRSPSPQVRSSEETLVTSLTSEPHVSLQGRVTPVSSPSQARPQEVSVPRCPHGETLNWSMSLRAASVPPASIPQQRPLLSRLSDAGEDCLKLSTKNFGNHRIATHENAEARTTFKPSASSTASVSGELKSDAPRKHLKQENKDVDREEEEFYSFVILHSPKDAELAGRLRERLESLVVGPGATFAQDFAVPGTHRLTCVDEAINNSAFTILLLSRNFNPRMLEFESNCALMSSIEHRHKYNTVIPLFPSENRLPREMVPGSLQIYVPLEEGSVGFERKARKAMAQDRIERQRSVWQQGRKIRAQRERALRAREDNERRTTLQRGTELAQEELRRSRTLLEHQKVLEHNQALLTAQLDQAAISPFPPSLDGFYYPPYPLMSPNVHPLTNPEGYLSLGLPFQQPSIHIENASCIMIGNDSQMTVGMGGEKPTGERAEDGPTGELQEGT
ncbi:hypothetical protein GJAV_G00086550 [Gymnothorax javanicus]|nr:hypothetical protein GJAV_G00086550 [Gymnothorax javanicus]